MKGLACLKCVDLRALAQGNLMPVSCRCENVTAWWIDGQRGVARYTAKAPTYALGVGFNNRFLLPALESAMSSGIVPDEEWRKLHDEATTAPGYLFDAARRDCWVVVFKPGTVRDVEWASDEERAAVGLGEYPAGHALKGSLNGGSAG